MSQNINDRRVKRTHRLLHQALRELMAEMRYETITVQDILDQADIGRTTFYAHYQDKEDLVTSMLIGLMEDLVSEIDESKYGQRQILPTRLLFEHIEENYEKLKGVMQGRVLELFFEKGKQFWVKRLEGRLQTLLPDAYEPAVPLKLVADSAAGTFLIHLKWWFDTDLSYSAEQMAQFADQLILPGVLSALGLSES